MEHSLDVSDLEPCEPMERTLEYLQTLTDEDHLRVTLRREPRPLYPLLEQMGFTWVTQPMGPAAFEVFIWKRGDAVATAAVNTRLENNDTNTRETPA
jgi:uncharacterized protein (DUF2249 family)